MTNIPRWTRISLSFIFLYAIVAHLFIVFAPWQLEYREGAVLFQIAGLLKGQRIYDTSSLPIYLNNYGFVYNFIGAQLSKLFGLGFFPMRFVTLVSIAASVALLNSILVRRHVMSGVRLTLCLYMYMSLLFSTTPLARADALGLLCLMACFWLFETYSTATWSMLLIIVLTMLGFLVKIYFLLAAPLVISYVFFFRSKAKGIIFTVIFFAALIATYKLDLFLFPGYLPTTVAVDSGMARAISGRSTFYMIRQTVEFFLMFLGAILMCWLFRTPNSGDSLWKLNRLSFPAYCTILMLLLMVTKFGHHDGQFLTYYIQLVAPFFLVAIAPSAQDGEPATWRDESVRNRFASILLPIICIMTAVMVYKSVLSPARVLKIGRETSTLSQDVQSKVNVLASPALVGVLTKQSKEIYDTGQSYDIPSAGNKRALRLPGIPLPASGFIALDTQHKKDVADQLRDKKFDMVLRDHADAMTDEQQALLEAGYKMTAVRPLDRLSEQEWVPR